MLHDAYSQNYSYLIKQSTDQYQVIVEVADEKRSDPEDLSKLYIRSGSADCPNERRHQLAFVGRAAGGQSHQPVHQRHHLLQPEARLRDRTCDSVCREGASSQQLRLLDSE
jgi:multidrug efflux pump subunit AcrB